jgi:starvation-inducible outer membrane lipoprotein
MNNQIKKIVILSIVTLSFLLSACKPQDIVLSNSDFERDVKSWVRETCPKSDGIHCDLMGQ